MSDLVLRFEDGMIVDFRSWPVHVVGEDGAWRPAVDSDGTMADVRDAIRLTPEEIAAIDARSKTNMEIKDASTEKDKIVGMCLKDPVDCHLWKKEIIAFADLDFEPVAIYFESSHFDRSLLRCKRCGQLYYTEFYEVVDWEHGDDDQYSTYIPVDGDDRVIEMLNKRSPLELLAVTPRIQWDHFKPIRWAR